MARKAGQIIARGPAAWLVRIYQGRDPQTGTRKYHNQTIHGPLREAQRFLSLRLEQRASARLSGAAAVILNQFLDQWLATAARARVRATTLRDYESLLRVYIRPVLGARFIGEISRRKNPDALCGDVRPQAVGPHHRVHERGSPLCLPAGGTLGHDSRGSLRWRRPAAGETPGDGGPQVEECRRFLAVAEKSPRYALFALALTTGMRPSEYLALKWSDIDWQRGTASISRTIQVSGANWTFDDTKRRRSRRVVKLQGFVLNALRVLREKQTAVGGRELPPRERPDLRVRLTAFSA